MSASHQRAAELRAAADRIERDEAEGPARREAWIEAQRNRRYPEKIGGEFGFAVGIQDFANGPRWLVLCNEDEPFEVACGIDKAEAIAKMERFVVEAQAALAKLKGP